jgi:prepilin-type N-terminal cleavage/methylation domain-containing protein
MKKGFTLAEILITLTIIGIVAAVTVPSLVNNTGDAQIATGVKNVYQILSEATEKLEMDTEGNGMNTNDLENSYSSVLKIMSSGINIFPDSTYKAYKSSLILSSDVPKSTDKALILNNGAYIAFSGSSTCGTTSPGCNAWVDINGRKSPNMLGRDLVKFYIYKDPSTGSYEINPSGVTDSATCSNAGTISASTGCTSYYITGNTLP